MGYLFASESVSEGHPDKVADQISDAILDAYLKLDPHRHVAIETLVTKQLVVLAGEVGRTDGACTWVNHASIARSVIREIGYTDPALNFAADSVEVNDRVHNQSGDIANAVDGNRKKARAPAIRA